MTYKEANNISIKDYLNSLGIQPVTEKRKLRDVPQPLTGGQHAKFQGGL